MTRLVHQRRTRLDERLARAAVVTEERDDQIDIADDGRPAELCGTLARHPGDHCDRVFGVLERPEPQAVLGPLRERVRITDIRTGPTEQLARGLIGAAVAGATGAPVVR